MSTLSVNVGARVTVRARVRGRVGFFYEDRSLGRDRVHPGRPLWWRRQRLRQAVGDGLVGTAARTVIDEQEELCGTACDHELLVGRAHDSQRVGG